MDSSTSCFPARLTPGGTPVHYGDPGLLGIARWGVWSRPCGMRILCFLVFAVIGTGIGWAQSPLPRAHSHNDYEHARPLFDALDQGFCGVEADIWRVGDQLLVAHERSQVRAGRTLESLYLAPLAERARTNKGAIHSGSPEFTLLVDVKTDPEGSYALLAPLLERYRGILTRFTHTNRTSGAVTVILSGSRPIEQVKAQSVRWCAIDGRLPDLEANPSPYLVPLVSDSWRPTFPVQIDAPLNASDRERLRSLVRKAHDQGRRIRFWGARDNPVVWREQFDAGVDLINTDKLEGLRGFLFQQPR